MCSDGVCEGTAPAPTQDRIWLRLVRRGIKCTLVYMIAAYVTWVLVGTVAFVSHLGAQSPSLAAFLPGRGQPGGFDKAVDADGLLQFLRLNMLAALLFVLPHSLLRPKRLSAWLGRIGLQAHDRLAYNVMAAVTLHSFLATSVPLRTPVVMVFPLAPALHLLLSGGCLIFAATCFLMDEGTPILLGIARSLGHANSERLVGMDAITWMGECVWRRGGSLAFVLFTGLSILPPELTFGDAVTRVTAAIYLRARSAAFRRWVEKIEGAHQLTHVLRGGLLVVALHRASQSQEFSLQELSLQLYKLYDWRVLGAVGVAAALHAFEVHGNWAAKARTARAVQRSQGQGTCDADVQTRSSSKQDNAELRSRKAHPERKLWTWGKLTACVSGILPRSV